MERELLRKVQLTQLEIAKEIRRVCEENDIPYFLTCGTLLGAVRHQGFIPWDDDMDVGMLRENYEKFCRIAPEKLNRNTAGRPGTPTPTTPCPSARCASAARCTWRPSPTDWKKTASMWTFSPTTPCPWM